MVFGNGPMVPYDNVAPNIEIFILNLTITKKVIFAFESSVSRDSVHWNTGSPHTVHSEYLY